MLVDIKYPPGTKLYRIEKDLVLDDPVCSECKNERKIKVPYKDYSISVVCPLCGGKKVKSTTGPGIEVSEIYSFAINSNTLDTVSDLLETFIEYYILPSGYYATQDDIDCGLEGEFIQSLEEVKKLFISQYGYEPQVVDETDD